MILNCETILNYYTLKNKKILCQIKVNPKSSKFKNSCRCLSQEHWKSFDKELEKVITTIDDWNNEKCLNFFIKPYIQVKVQKSKLSLRHFYKCLDAFDDHKTGDDGEISDVVEANFVLECLFEFQLDKSFFDLKIKKAKYFEDVYKFASERIIEHYMRQNTNDRLVHVPLNSSTEKYELESHIETSLDNRSKKRERFERQTEEHCAVQEKNQETDNLKQKRRKCDSKDVFLKKLNENFTVKHTSSKMTKKRSKTLDETSAEFLISIEQSLPKNKFENIAENPHGELNDSGKDKAHKSKKNKSKRERREKSTESLKKLRRSLSDGAINMPFASKLQNSPETPPMNVCDNELGDDFKVDKNTTLQNGNENFSNLLTLPTACANNTSPQHLNDINEDIKSLRRSQRSPTKPNRYIEEEHNLLNKKEFNKNKKSALKKKQLFGSEYDDDNYCTNNNSRTINNKITSVLKTSGSEKSDQFNSFNSPSLPRKRRIRDTSGGECVKEKHIMSNWLSKKKVITLSKQPPNLSKVSTKSSSSKAFPFKTSVKSKSIKSDDNSEKCTKPITPAPLTLELPSQEELELIRNKTKLKQKENAKVRAELDKMRSSPPKEVEILSLQNIPVDDILNTFLTYKSELDEVYENNRKRDYIKGHDGINHCFVIRLLQQNIQMKMLKKLTEVYSNSNTTTQATLFANALLPEWVIRVYMNKFNFTRQQAIEQIKAQEEFQLHLEEQNENSFMFE